MPVTRESDRVMIIGGGIAGLGVAVTLRLAGIEAVVFEQAPRLGEVGTGVGLWFNGTLALRRMGVLEPVEQGGAAVETQYMCSWRHGTLFEVPVGEFARRYDVPPAMMVRRPAIIDGLKGALEDRDVELGASFVGFEQDEAGVTARFDDGREERGAALIGADGIRSMVRRSLFPDAEPRYAGYQYLRGMTRRDERLHPEHHFNFTFGPGDRFGLGDVGGDQLYWWAVVVTPQGSTDSEIGRKGELLERFADFPEMIAETIESTPDESILRSDIFDLEPMESWGEGRAMLVGDAAHATTPNLGRGGGEALEDAVVMAERLRSVDLADGAAVSGALSSFEEARREPTAKVQNSAWRIGKTASWSDPVRCRVRELVFKQVGRRVLPKQLESDLATAAAEPLSPVKP